MTGREKSIAKKICIQDLKNDIENQDGDCISTCLHIDLHHYRLCQQTTFTRELTSAPPHSLRKSSLQRLLSLTSASPRSLQRLLSLTSASPRSLQLRVLNLSRLVGIWNHVLNI